MFSIHAFHRPAHAPPKDKNSWPKGAELRTLFGWSIFWWPKEYGGYHMDPEQLEPYRTFGDPHLDFILNEFEKEERAIGPRDNLLEIATEAESLEESKRTNAQTELLLFLEKYKTLPPWVDKDQLKRGQEVFLAYLPVASLSLYYYSLVAGFAIPKIAAVIQSTAYLSPPSRPDQSMQRILDTGELIAACTGLGIDSILPGGGGWKTALHVRVLHAKVRRALLRRKGERKWDTETFGIPINQEDMAATLLAFSVNVLDGIDVIAGSAVRKEEKADYIALWRYIGWLLGVETCSDERSHGGPSNATLPPLDPCGPGIGPHPDACQNASAMLDSCMCHLLDPDESSVKIAHHLLSITDRTPPARRLSQIPQEFYKNDLYYYRALQCRRLLGEPLAEVLRLPFPKSMYQCVKIWLRSSLILGFLRLYTLTTMHVPFLRRRIIRLHSNATAAYHRKWEMNHLSALRRALLEQDNVSCVGPFGEDDDDSNHHILVSSQQMCPFAMIACP